jgi:transitional endoplasmic reticulum ATPase
MWLARSAVLVTVSMAKLRVAEAAQADVGFGIARLGSDTLQQLGIKVGEVVRVQGGRETAAVVQRAPPADDGRGIVRLEAVVRRNAKTSLGEVLHLERVEAPVAEAITIAPVYSGAPTMDMGTGLEAYVAKALSRRPFVRGDAFVVPGVFLMGGSLLFLVTATTPKGVVVVGPNTLVTVCGNTVKEDEIHLGRTFYEDVGGVREALAQFREVAELPLRHPEALEKAGHRLPSGILLYGPPGTGKFRMAQALANEVGVHFVGVDCPEVAASPEEEAVTVLKSVFAEARRKGPTLLCLDEMEAIALRRDLPSVNARERRSVWQLASLLDETPEKDRGPVLVVGTTERLDAIDPLLLRPGRFDHTIEVKLPDEEGRKEVLHILLRAPRRLAGTAEEMEQVVALLAKGTEGFSAADLGALVREAGLRTVRRSVSENLAAPGRADKEPSGSELGPLTNREDFTEALARIVPMSRRGAPSPG